MKLLIRNRVKIFLIKSSSSGDPQAKRNRENGIRVVFKKKEIKFLMRIILIFPVNVYLFYQSVSLSIKISSKKLVT